MQVGPKPHCIEQLTPARLASLPTMVSDQAKVLYMVPARQGLLPGGREPARNRRIFLKYAIKSAFFRVSTLLLRYLKLNTVVSESRFFSAAKTPAVQGPCTILLPDTIVQ